MKVLVIMTGGTISSFERDGYLAPQSDIGDILKNEYINVTCDKDTEFEFLSPFTILSENLTAENLNNLMDVIRASIDKGYNGIIITHGTDTLQYSAACLGFAFSDTKIPIVFVSAAYPLSDTRTNGFVNFISAVKFLKKGIGGVFVSYKNDRDEKAKMHIATRLFTHNESLADIESMGGEIEPLNDTKKLPEFKLSKEAHILSISMTPGDSYSYSLENVCAVIIRPYHSGTVNSESDAFGEVLKKAENKKIPVFLVNSKEGRGYESTKDFENLPITVLPPSAFPAIYMKCWIAKSIGEDMEEFVKTPIYYEFI